MCCILFLYLLMSLVHSVMPSVFIRRLCTSFTGNVACLMGIIWRLKGCIGLSGQDRNKWSENTIIWRKRLKCVHVFGFKWNQGEITLYVTSFCMHLVMAHIKWLFHRNPFRIRALLRLDCLWLYPTQLALPSSAQNMCLNTSLRVSMVALASKMNCDSGFFNVPQ